MGKFQEDCTITSYVEGDGIELSWRIILDLDNRRIRIRESPKSEIAAEDLVTKGYLIKDFDDMTRDMLMAMQRFAINIKRQELGLIHKTVQKDDEGSIRYVNIKDTEKESEEDTGIQGPTRG